MVKQVGGTCDDWSLDQELAVGTQIHSLEPQHFKSRCVVFFETRSHACAKPLFSRGTLCERTRCERHCATIPFLQTCSRRYLWRASRSVSTLRKKARIPSANIKKHRNHKRKTRKVFFDFGRTTQHHVRGSVLIRSDGKAHKICGSRQHTHGTEDAQPYVVKTEHTSVDAA